MEERQSVRTDKDIIIELLESTGREGIKRLIERIDRNGFFDSPASTKYHGCYAGGLAKHSLSVYYLLTGYAERFKLGVPKNSIIIAALLHDVCKVGAYIGDNKPYTFNRMQPKGHAALSVRRIKEFMTLTELEEKMIQYHMGVYGLREFQDLGKEPKGEYTLRTKGMANAWYHYPIVKLMYFCDEIATLQEKAEEAK